MYKRLLIACSVLVLAACNSATTTTEEVKKDEPAPPAPLADGWIRLFDGTSITGWHKYGGDPAGTSWKIKDSVLYLDTSVKINNEVVAGGDLTTNDEYENFDLKLEWKIAPGGNSGIIFLVNEDTAKYHESYETGPEYQLLDNDGHPDGKIARHRAGDLYDLIAVSKETVKPVGEWNQSEIRILNGQLDFYLNGEHTVSTTLWDNGWKKLIAGSKFKSMPGFGTFKKGHIVLQDHHCMIAFKNIEIRKL
jgi:hypothetical protein